MKQLRCGVLPRGFCAVGLLLFLSLEAGAQFATTPLTPQWITNPAGGTNQESLFAKSFKTDLPLLKSILLGACEGQMEAYLNGELIGEISGPDRATGLDLTRHLRTGTNILIFRAMNSNGLVRVSTLIEVNSDLAKVQWIASDASWVCSTNSSLVTAQSLTPMDWKAPHVLGRVTDQPNANPFDAKKAFDAYNSWKLALGSNAATDPATFTLAPGFKAELLRSAQPGEGSWVSMAFDLKGRLTLARENRGLIRLTLGSNGQRVEVIDDTLLECRGLLYAYDALYVNANNSKGFYRLRDNDGDDRFDEVKLLLRTGGNVGHGRNHVVLGPDGAIWLVHGNNVTLTDKAATNSPLKDYRNDSLIPCPFDDVMFDGDVLLPAGHILRTDRDGSRFELFAGGFRNPLDIAFNADGEMFTFDADMEWDVGSPWYRPNRVNHVISGADFGWRRGTAKFPDYFPETLPSTLDIGLASPTGIEFGTHSRFPSPYREALFVADWAYGRVLAIHLKPKGASYSATSELFVSGRPLNVTDLTFGPDGAMYLITGGRTTQSGLYRISYAGPEIAMRPKTSDELASETAAAEARNLRRQLEAFHSPTNQISPKRVIDAVWPHLGHSDQWIRHAARVALEHQPVELWRQRALQEASDDVALTAWLALARTGKADAQRAVLERLNAFSFSSLSEQQQLIAFRTYEIACARGGKPSPDLLNAMRAKLEPLYPANDWHLNHRLCVLLVYLESALAIPRTLDLLARTERPEDLMHYLFYLRYVRTGWTKQQREQWVRALARAEQKQGARDYYVVLKRVRDEFLAALPADLAQHLSKIERDELHPNAAEGSESFPVRHFVKQWQVSDFDLNQPMRMRSLQNGRAAFHAAQCVLCHRFGSEGGLVGPDLTSVASRFDRRTVLESILDPSKVIDDKFRNTNFRLSDGTVITGTVDREDEEQLFIRESPFAERSTMISKASVVRRELSPVSPMPAGLVDILDRDSILDLLAYLESTPSTNSASARP